MNEDVTIRVRFVGDEARALRELSSREVRKPNQQTRYLILRELKRLGLLEPDEEQESRDNLMDVNQ